jgi:hypothetical protein
VAKVRLYSGNACTTEELATNVSASEPEQCFPLIPGVALTSKAAEVLAYEPGACAPAGGAPVGELVLAEQTTFCCLVSAT